MGLNTSFSKIERLNWVLDSFTPVMLHTVSLVLHTITLLNFPSVYYKEDATPSLHLYTPVREAATPPSFFTPTVPFFAASLHLYHFFASKMQRSGIECIARIGNFVSSVLHV